MKKTVALLMVLVMALCLLCSCGDDSATMNAPDGMKALTSSDKLDYNIYVPFSWTQDLSTGVVSAYAGMSDLSNISMTQYNYEENKILEDYIKDYTEELKGNLGKFEMCEGYPQNTLLDKVESVKLEYTATLASKDYKFMQIITLKNGTMYFFTYTALADAYDAHTEDIQKILDNFDFK